MRAVEVFVRSERLLAFLVKDDEALFGMNAVEVAVTKPKAYGSKVTVPVAPFHDSTPLFVIVTAPVVPLRTMPAPAAVEET